MMPNCVHYHCHTFLQGDVKSRHAHISNREEFGPLITFAYEERNDATSATHYIAVTNDRETNIFAAADVIGCGKEFIACQLGCTIEIYWSTSFICTQRYDIVYSASQSGFNNILRSMHICFNAFLRIIFCSIYLFDSRSMYDNIYSLARTSEAL